MTDTETITEEHQAPTFTESVLPAASLRETDPEALVEAIATEMSSEPRPDLVELVASMGVPTPDCLTTVLSARATLLAASRGRAFYSHELRGRIPMPPHLEPEVDVWEGETVPVWQDGVYVEPKYFSFRQDAPFAAYNPVHRRKWRPHELLHGAVGFFWRKEASRFETYVGSRLNELLPVVHWYGLDEIYRPRCERHRGQLLYRDWCNACEAAARPYWEVEPEDHEAAIRFARDAREHFVSEMAACRSEIATGRVHATPRGRLDASSDSVGYLRGHWRRVTAWSFQTWVELFLREGFDYFEHLDTYADRVEACTTRLVGGVVATPRRFQALRQRRILQDVAYRALVALEWLDPDTPEAQGIDRAVMSALERCSDVVEDLVDSDDARREADDALDELVAVLHDTRDGFPDQVADPLLAFGLPFWEKHGRDGEFELANLALGISQGAPLTADRVDAGHIETFASSRFFATTGRIVSRFARYLGDRADDDDAQHRMVSELAALEGWAGEDPRRDEDAEWFGQPIADPDAVNPADLRLNDTVRRSSFDADAVSELANVQFSTDRVELVAAYWHGELHLIEADDAVAGVLAAVAMGAMPKDLDALVELNAAGIVVWVPGARLEKPPSE